MLTQTLCKWYKMSLYSINSHLKEAFFSNKQKYFKNYCNFYVQILLILQGELVMKMILLNHYLNPYRF